uniref:Uncharacterized protein n=1 Tax=Arundo donax TaxID=35708 RepID=A0A0A8Y7K5_ARUDO
MSSSFTMPAAAGSMPAAQELGSREPRTPDRSKNFDSSYQELRF